MFAILQIIIKIQWKLKRMKLLREKYPGFQFRLNCFRWRHLLRRGDVHHRNLQNWLKFVPCRRQRRLIGHRGPKFHLPVTEDCEPLPMIPVPAKKNSIRILEVNVS